MAFKWRSGKATFSSGLRLTGDTTFTAQNDQHTRMIMFKYCWWRSITRINYLLRPSLKSDIYHVIYAWNGPNISPPSRRSVELLATGEPVDHVERPLGLVKRNHVTGIANQDLGEVAHTLGVASQVATHMPTLNGNMWIPLERCRYCMSIYLDKSETVSLGYFGAQMKEGLFCSYIPQFPLGFEVLVLSTPFHGGDETLS